MFEILVRYGRGNPQGKILEALSSGFPQKDHTRVIYRSFCVRRRTTTFWRLLVVLVAVNRLENNVKNSVRVEEWLSKRNENILA